MSSSSFLREAWGIVLGMFSARRVAVIVASALLGLLAGYGMVNALDVSEPLPVEPIVLDRVPAQPAGPVTTTSIPGASMVVPPPTLPPLPPPPPDQPPARDQPPPPPSDGDDDDDDGNEDADTDDREDDEVTGGDD